MDGSFPSGPAAEYDGDRSGGGGRAGFKGTTENAKTRMCNRWMQGDCRFGDRCNFAHGDHELRPLPPREGGGYDNAGYQGSSAPRGRGPMGGYAGRSPGGRFGGGRGYGGPPGGGYGGQPGYGGQAPGYSGGQGGGYGGQHSYGEQPGYGGQGYGGPPAAQPRQDAANMMWPLPQEGPNGWLMYTVKDNNEPYFHNPRTNVTTWERPPEWR